MKYPDRVGKHVKCSVAGETYQAYVPNPLPPTPPIRMEKLSQLLEKANVAIGRLDGLSVTLPDPSLEPVQSLLNRWYYSHLSPCGRGRRA